MRLEDNDFFYDNIAYVNKLVAKILSLTVLLSPTFYLLSKYGIFNISRTYVLVTLFLTVPFSIIQLILVFYFGSKSFKEKYTELYYFTQKFAMYFGLCISSVILGIIGTNSHIGIYISYVIIIFCGTFPCISTARRYLVSCFHEARTFLIFGFYHPRRSYPTTFKQK